MRRPQPGQSLVRHLGSTLLVLILAVLGVGFYLINDNVLEVPLPQEQVFQTARECVDEKIIQSPKKYTGFEGLALKDLTYQKLAYPSPYDDQLITVFFAWASPRGPQVLTVDLERRYYYVSQSFSCYFPRLAKDRTPQTPRSRGQKIFIWLVLLGFTTYFVMNPHVLRGEKKDD